MKKFLIAAATLAVLSTASFADQNTDNINRMDMARMQRAMIMTKKMMVMLKDQEAMLGNYQKLLKRMMDNDNSSHRK